MPYLTATLGGTNGKITVIRDMEVESKLRIKRHNNSPACFVILKSQGTAKENRDYFFLLSKAAVISSEKYSFNNSRSEPYLKKLEYMKH